MHCRYNCFEKNTVDQKSCAVIERKSMVQTKRIEWIDFLRVLSIFGVLLIHSVEKIYTFNPDYMLTVSSLSRLAAFVMFTLGRLGVPIFLMISGYLLLDREYNEKRTVLFWKKNWLHLLICTEIWFFIYEMFLKIYAGKSIGILQILADMFFLHEIDVSHLWYMPMILGFYILIPFAANALRSLNVRMLIFPVIVYSVFAFGYPVLNLISRITLEKELSLQFSMGFSGGCYGLYLLIGYFLKKGGLRKVRSWILMVLAGLFFILGVGIQLWAYKNNYRYNIWYDSIFIFIASTALFELVSRIRYVWGYKVVQWLSAYSFAVYLIHNIFRMILGNYMNAVDLRRPVKVFILCTATAVISYAAVWLIAKIPRIGKYIFYMK